MTRQDPTDLFDPARRIHHRDDPSTSRQAAEIMVAKLPRVQKQVMAFFYDAGKGGASQHDLGRHFKALARDPERYAHATHRSRVPELEAAGLLFKVGTKSDPITKNAVNVYVHKAFMPGDAKATGKPAKASMESLRTEILRLENAQFDLWNACVAAAPHHQGAHSAVGEAIAKALGIPFPITMANIPPRKARSEAE